MSKRSSGIHDGYYIDEPHVKKKMYLLKIEEILADDIDITLSSIRRILIWIFWMMFFFNVMFWAGAVAQANVLLDIKDILAAILLG